MQNLHLNANRLQMCYVTAAEEMNGPVGGAGGASGAVSRRNICCSIAVLAAAESVEAARINCNCAFFTSRQYALVTHQFTSPIK